MKKIQSSKTQDKQCCHCVFSIKDIGTRDKRHEIFCEIFGFRFSQKMGYKLAKECEYYLPYSMKTGGIKNEI